ncbi:MAG: DNA translocase FtsK [Chthoniobacterales bacterium]|nr:DNA translocase FtsK [Chthoniobacterales bacterium]
MPSFPSGCASVMKTPLARGTTEGGSKAWSEVLGLLLLGAGTLLFLALVSYSSADVSSFWWFGTQEPPQRPPENFIGPVGAIVAAFCYFHLGAASYLLAVMLIGFGGAKFLHAGLDLKRRLGWMAAFVLSGACLAGIQPWFLQGWKTHFKIEGPGGWFGLVFGENLLKALLGGIGATILLLIVYLASLILMTGMHPVKFCKAVMAAIPEKLRQWREARIEKKRAEQEMLVEEALATTPRSKPRTAAPRARRKPTPAAEEEEDEEEEQEEIGPEPPLPEPKIIDTGAIQPPAKKPPAPPPKKKKEAGPLGSPPDVHIENYQLPPLDLLDSADAGSRQSADPNELLATQSTILETLKQFGLEASAGDITRGPTVTRFEVYPARGVRVDRITSLERDIARATRAEKINILAPIPGKDTVGIEIANSKKIKVVFRELLESEEWANSKAKIPLALGKDVYGRTIIADLAQMPHLLIAGTTGSGKSVCVNAIIASMLYKFSPEELRFIMIDPKVVEMQHYGKLPHLAANVVTEPKKVLLALRYVIDEMERRYRIFAKCGLRNIHGFNARPLDKKEAGDTPPPEPETAEEESEGGIEDEVLGAPPPAKKEEELKIPDRLPFIVVIIDELADLMQTAPADVENAIARITQMARAAGIHMIVATQTPRADVVTGVIKANIPSRIAFQVASKLDSRVILDANGAEKLLGQGDMLYLPPGTSTLVRAQGVLVTDDEIHRVVDCVSAQAQPTFDPGFHEAMTSTASADDDVTEEDEELVAKCLEIIKQERKASTSMLQRRLRLGYTRAARVVDILEQRGIVGPKDGAKDREILVDLDSLP